MTGEPPEESVESIFVQLDLSIVVPPGVMPITRASDLLASAVLKEVGEEDRVLDYGTGSGVNAILAARKSPNVVAVDIVPRAVAAARSNAVRNRVADRLTVLRSNGFDAVTGRFDVIIVDLADTDERGLQTFFEGLDARLEDGGRVLINAAMDDDLGTLLAMISDHDLDREMVTQRTVPRGLHRLTYAVFRLTRRDYRSLANPAS